jgi:transcriptional regulator with XRE-family HTH domain
MDQLKRLRTEKGLSQAKLAALADIDPSTVNQIERGAREASPPTLRKLAQALDVTLAELLEDVSPKARAARLLEPSLNDALADERRLDNEAALAVLFRGLARRGRLIVERSRREGPSEGLGDEAATFHAEANALYRLRGPRDIFGRASEELAEAEDEYTEVEGIIQAMLRQDVEANAEEREQARKFRRDASDTSKRREVDAS